MNQRLQNLIIVGSILLIGFVAFYMMKNALAWAVIPGLIAVPWMLGDPKRLLAGYWAWATVTEYAYQITRVGALRYGDELLLGCILIAMIFQHALKRTSFPDVRGMVRLFWGLLALSVVSHIVNRGGHVDAAVTMVQYLRPLLLGYYAYTVLKPEDLPGVAKFFVFTLLIQLAMNLLWLLDINPLPHPGIYVGVDFAVGTMGSGTYVAYTTCIGIALCLSVFLIFRSVLYLALAGVLALSLMLTNTAHANAFLALMLLLMGLTFARGAPQRLLAVVMGTVPIAAIAMLIHFVSPAALGLDTYIRRGNDLLSGRKMDAYRRHLFDLPRESSIPFFLWLGTGPGTLGSAMADQRGYLASKYHGWTFTGAEAEEVQTRSIITHTRTGLLAIWSDFGPLAFLLYWGSHLYALFRVIGLYRRSSYELPWQRVFALTFVPLMVLYLLVAAMTDIVHTALWGCVAWTAASIAWTPQHATELAEEEPQPDAAPEEDFAAALAVSHRGQDPSAGAHPPLG